MTTFTVVLDACVLYPAPLRDLLLNLTCLGLFRARWTSEIPDEWIRNLLRDRPDLTPEQLQRARELSNGPRRAGLPGDGLSANRGFSATPGPG